MLPELFTSMVQVLLVPFQLRVDASALSFCPALLVSVHAPVLPPKVKIPMVDEVLGTSIEPSVLTVKPLVSLLR